MHPGKQNEENLEKNPDFYTRVFRHCVVQGASGPFLASKNSRQD
jgi:hypothetical protein